MGKIRQPLILTIILLLTFVSTVFAGRPLNTDDTGTVPPKEVEVELAYEFVDQADQENNLSLVLTTGIFDTFDIGVEIPYQFIDVKNGSNENGLSDIGITTKLNFLQENDDLFDATLSFSYKTTSGDESEGLGTGDQEYTILTIISKNVDDITLHVNLGSTIIDNADDVFNYNLAGEWAVSDELNFVAEVFGTNDFKGSFDENSMSVLIGFAYVVNENTVYDLGVSSGISEADPDLNVTTGLTIAL